MKLITRSLCIISMICMFISCSADPETEIAEAANLESHFDTTQDQIFANEVLDIVNDHRSNLGLNDLDFHVESKNKAVEHTTYMVEQNKMSHDNFFQRSDYLKTKGADFVSENVAYGQRSPEAVVAAWLKSPSHKEAIESDYTHTGIGVVANKNGVNYYTQIFIK